MFGSSKVDAKAARAAMETHNAEVLKKAEEERAVKAAAVESWQARCEAAVAAVVLPEKPYRIKRISMPHTWDVEVAHAMAVRSWPAGSPKQPRKLGLISYVFGIWDYSPEELDADQPQATLIWSKIGGDFATYDAAEAFLRAYLKPVAEEVYFGAEEFL